MDFCTFWRLKFTTWTEFTAPKMAKTADFTLLESSKLTSRKISVIQKSWNSHTVKLFQICLQSHQLFVYILLQVMQIIVHSVLWRIIMWSTMTKQVKFGQILTKFFENFGQILKCFRFNDYVNTTTPLVSCFGGGTALRWWWIETKTNI